jgi:hypothetical protein
VEAQLCGTQPIATDWGAFPETVAPEYRFHTIGEGVDAVFRAFDTDPDELQANALAQWSLDAIRPRYERWFDQLLGLWAGGFYSLPRSRA